VVRRSGEGRRPSPRSIRHCTPPDRSRREPPEATAGRPPTIARSRPLPPPAHPVAWRGIRGERLGWPCWGPLAGVMGDGVMGCWADGVAWEGLGGGLGRGSGGAREGLEGVVLGAAGVEKAAQHKSLHTTPTNTLTPPPIPTEPTPQQHKTSHPQHITLRTNRKSTQKKGRQSAPFSLHCVNRLLINNKISKLEKPKLPQRLCDITQSHPNIISIIILVHNCYLDIKRR